MKAKTKSSAPKQRRRKTAAEKLLTAAVEPALRLMIDTMNDPEEKSNVRLECARDILARVYGKTPAPLAGPEEAGEEKVMFVLSEELEKLSE